MLPYGGTEIQYDYLRKYGNRNLIDLVQITTSVPEKEPLHPLRPNILWIKNSYDQPNLAPWFTKKENHKKYDWYVFNSHWTYEKYRYFFNVPDTRSVVIKNGVDYDQLKIKKDFTYKEPLRLIYFSTPWRGLDVLLNAMELLKDEKDIVLDVYSSTIIYGDEFHRDNEPKFLKLYERAGNLKNVNYKGYCRHDELLGKLKDQSALSFILASLSACCALGLLYMPSFALVWTLLLGFSSGACFILGLSFISLRTDNSTQAASLSGMSQSIGYLLAAIGPMVAGALHTSTGSWSAPLWLCAGAGVLCATCGWFSGKNTTLNNS